MSGTERRPTEELAVEVRSWFRPIRPVGTDTDGNGIWTDGVDAWNSGEPLTPAEVAEAEESTAN